MENKDLIENKCREYLEEELGEDCAVSVTIANKIKVELGEDFYISGEDGKIGYVKFRGWYNETGNTIRKIKKCLSKHITDFSKLILANKNNI